MTRDLIIDRIRKSTSMPTLPTVAVKVLELVRCDEVQIDDIATLISIDPALSAKVLRTVNSPFYGLSQKVSTISNALVILGIEAVKTLVLGFSLVHSLRDERLRDETQIAYWRRSIYSAVASRLLSQRLGLAEREELFLGTLLRDIGIQVLRLVVGPEYDKLLVRTPVWDRQLVRAERAMLGLCHCEAGLVLAEQWHLPPILAQIIRWHHFPRYAERTLVKACRLVRLATLFAEIFASPPDARQVKRARTYAQFRFNMPPESSDILLTEISCSTQELADLFDVNIGQQRPYEEILAEVSEALQTLTLRSQMQASQMRSQAETDPLTGLANRRKLEEKVDQEFARARAFLRPVSILFIDADHFKRVNDSLGHAAGDQTLQHVADVIRSVLRPADMAGRYGGEEFVVVLPEMGLARAVKVAERIRVAIQSSPVPLPGRSWPLTVSIGVASVEPAGSPYRNAGQLLHAADRAAYAAKAAGRNTIRVFAPRRPTLARNP